MIAITWILLKHLALLFAQFSCKVLSLWDKGSIFLISYLNPISLNVNNMFL